MTMVTSAGNENESNPLNVTEEADLMNLTTASGHRMSPHDHLTPFGGLAALIPDVSNENALVTAALEHQQQHHQQQKQVQVSLGPSAGPSRRDSLISNSMLPMTEHEEEDSEEESTRGEKRAGRRKIQIAYIEDKSRRHITFSKRKAGIMKKVLKVFLSLISMMYPLLF